MSHQVNLNLRLEDTSRFNDGIKVKQKTTQNGSKTKTSVCTLDAFERALASLPSDAQRIKVKLKGTFTDQEEQRVIEILGKTLETSKMTVAFKEVKPTTTFGFNQDLNSKLVTFVSDRNIAIKKVSE